MKVQCRAIFADLLIVFFALLPATATAWTDDIASLEDVNTLCRFEPEAQCTSAVRIGAQAPGVDMHDASMPSMRLDGANLQGANLSNAILQLANLKGANLMFANLENAHMHGVNLKDANLSMANLRKANLLDADLSGANLRGANLQGAILIKARLDFATWSDGKVCAEGSIGKCR